MDMGALVLKVGLNKVIMEPELGIMLAPGNERHALLLHDPVQLPSEQGGGGRPDHSPALPPGAPTQATGLPPP